MHISPALSCMYAEMHTYRCSRFPMDINPCTCVSLCMLLSLCQAREIANQREFMLQLHVAHDR
jgi:hypothetical protein